MKFLLRLIRKYLRITKTKSLNTFMRIIMKTLNIDNMKPIFIIKELTRTIMNIIRKMI
jgi:hypothetical protein